MCVYVRMLILCVNFNLHFVPSSVIYAVQMHGLYYLPKHILKQDADERVRNGIVSKAMFSFHG